MAELKEVTLLRCLGELQLEEQGEMSSQLLCGIRGASRRSTRNGLLDSILVTTYQFQCNTGCR